jgi:hypothetical protein
MKPGRFAWMHFEQGKTCIEFPADDAILHLRRRMARHLTVDKWLDVSECDAAAGEPKRR